MQQITNTSKNPDFLYHYTSINTLALILSTKKIKFNSLPFVDDMEEENIRDEAKLAKYCFISAWTNKKSESIAMWEMYSNGMNGVRIGLPSNLFNDYKLSAKSLIEHFSPSAENSKATYPEEGLIPSPVDEYEYFNEKNNYLGSLDGADLIAMKYTNCIDMLRPQLFQKRGNDLELHNKMGVCKKSIWKFQSEWRYIISIFPFNFIEAYGHPLDYKKTRKYFELLSASAPDLCSTKAHPELPKCFLLPIDINKLKEIKIMLGPKTNDGDRLIIEALCHEYLPGMKTARIITKSSLKIRK